MHHRGLHGCRNTCRSLQLGRRWGNLRRGHVLHRQCGRLSADRAGKELGCSGGLRAFWTVERQRFGEFLFTMSKSWLLKAGLKTEFATGVDVQKHIGSPLYCASAYERRSGHLHPLKYTLGLAHAARKLGVVIYEQTPVTALKQGVPA